MRILIETIPRHQMRYATDGDWFRTLNCLPAFFRSLLKRGATGEADSTRSNPVLGADTPGKRLDFGFQT